MSIAVFTPEMSRLRALLDHFAIVDDPREQWRVAHPLPEVLLLVVCGTIADCDDYERDRRMGRSASGIPAPLHALPSRRFRARDWLNVLMNRVDPGLFSTAFTGWVRETWPDRVDLVATMARPRAAATIAALRGLLFILYLPSPPPAVSFSARRRCRQSQRDQRYPNADRTARCQGWPQRGAGLDRRHCDKPDRCDFDQRRRSRLSARREGQSANAALRDRALLRRRSCRQSRARRGCGQGPWPH